jgi:hypothetical protein
MSLTNRYKATATAERPPGITCPHYESQPGEKRCRHYVKGGACARPDEFMCIEWLKANGHAVASATPPAAEAPKPDDTQPAPKGATDLFGKPLPVPPAATSARKPPPVGAMGVGATSAPEPEARPPLRGLTTEDIESFKALGVEVCLRSEAIGEVWLVPDYTGRERKEITPEHAATLCRVLDAFPGSQVVSFEKNPEPEKEADA